MHNKTQINLTQHRLETAEEQLEKAKLFYQAMRLYIEKEITL